MNFTMKHVVLTLALAGVFSTANATVLTPNVLTPSVDVTPAFFGGTLLDSAVTSINNSSFSGTARVAVYDSGSGLDFYYQFSNDASSKSGIERFSAYDYSSLGVTAVDVFQTATGFGIFTNGTENSNYADRTLAGVIGFNFVPDGFSKIAPGTTSFIQIIRTNATAYTSGNFGLLDGIADNAVGFAPTPVPEPETYGMMLAGLGLMGFISKRRLAKRAAGSKLA
ncbi:MAG: PEP-CTERM sorting domain-containing protein [Methylophilaceae bacterium]